MGGALRLSGPAKALDLLTVMQENRRNDETLQLKLLSLHKAISDVHTTVKSCFVDLSFKSSFADPSFPQCLAMAGAPPKRRREEVFVLL